MGQSFVSTPSERQVVSVGFWQDEGSGDEFTMPVGGATPDRTYTIVGKRLATIHVGDGISYGIRLRYCGIYAENP
jgi:hypothetical protein